jgi:(2Fe-2S) ferredoxin
MLGRLLRTHWAQEKSFGYASRVIDQPVRDPESRQRTAPTCFVVACRGPNCRERGGLAFRKRLVELLRHAPSTRMVGYACFGQCDFGPNVAFFPKGEWYGGLSDPDAAERVARHATTGAAMNATPLSLPKAERDEHVKNIAELIGMLERDRVRKRRWWWPF